MYRAARVLGSLLSLAMIASLTACNLTCLFTPGACSSTNGSSGGGGGTPVVQVRLVPDTLWLVRPGVAAVSQIALITRPTDTATYAISISNLPAGLFAWFSPASARSGVPANVQLGIFSAYSGTDFLDVVANGPVHQGRGRLIVTTAKPFTLSTSVPSVSIEAGKVGTVPISVNRAPNFSGDVLLGSTGGPVGAVISITAGPAPVNNGTVTLTVGANAVPGTYQLVLNGVYKSFFDTLAVPVTVTAAPPPVDFGLTVTPNAITIDRGGGGATATVGITRTDPQVGAINLVAENAPTGVLINFSTPSASGAVSGVGITATALASVGTYIVNVAGTWNNITHRVSLTLNILDPDFTLSLSQRQHTVGRGAAGAAATVNINRLSPVIKGVDLNTQNLPTGVLVNFSANPAPGPLSGIGITATSQAVVGTYTFQITGEALDLAGGNLGVRRSVDVELIIIDPSIGLSLQPPSLTLVAGGPAVSTQVSIARLAIALPVTLTVSGLPNGVTPVITQPGTGANATISLSAAAAAATGGPFTATAVATAGNVSQSTPLTLTIQAPQVADFQIVPPAGPNVVRQNDGHGTAFTIAIARHASFNAVPISLSISGLASHEGTLSLSPTQTTGNSTTVSVYVNSTVPPGSKNLTITGTANGITRTATLTLTVVPPL